MKNWVFRSNHYYSPYSRAICWKTLWIETTTWAHHRRDKFDALCHKRKKNDKRQHFFSARCVKVCTVWRGFIFVRMWCDDWSVGSYTSGRSRCDRTASMKTTYWKSSRTSPVWGTSQKGKQNPFGVIQGKNMKESRGFACHWQRVFVPQIYDMQRSLQTQAWGGVAGNVSSLQLLSLHEQMFSSHVKAPDLLADRRGITKKQRHSI